VFTAKFNNYYIRKYKEEKSTEYFRIQLIKDLSIYGNVREHKTSLITWCFILLTTLEESCPERRGLNYVKLCYLLE
jgi:hypothetical protein